MKVDVLVIGGGSTGTSIAYYLSERGAGRVALLERQYVAWGQTGRSTAVVRLHYSTPEVARMALISWEVLREMERKIGGPSGFRACGFAIAAGQEDLEGLRKNVEMQRSLGINTRLITPEELREIQPQIDTDGLAGAAYEPESGYADPVMTAQTFAEAAARNGCIIKTKTEVKGFRVDGNRIKAVLTDKEIFEADVIVNASGVWSNQVTAELGLNLPVEVVKEEIAVWKRPEEFRGEHIVFADLPNNYYMRPFGDTQTYMGSINPDLSRREREPTAFNLDERVSMDTFMSYGELISRRFPCMVKAEAAGGWIGLYDITPDWHPIIGRSSKFENLYNAVGMSGHGFKLCPAFGMLVSDLILRDGKSDVVNPDFFSERRFAEGRLIGTSYQYGVIS